MIPSCSMCSNSRLTALSRSGANRQGRAETGGQVVSMCCKISSGESLVVRRSQCGAICHQRLPHVNTQSVV